MVSIATPSWGFGTPAVLLSLACLALGLLPSTEDSLASASVRGLYAGAESVHLAIWHGWNLELTLSLLALGTGVLVFALFNRGRTAPRPRLQLPVGERAYFGSLRGVAVDLAPRDGCRAERLAARVRRRDPHHLRGTPRVRARDQMGLERLADGRRSRRLHPDHRLPPGCGRGCGHGPPPLRRRPVPRRHGIRDGRVLRRVRRARPRAHPGGGRDVVDGRVRARAPAAPEAVRAAVDVAPSRRAGAHRRLRRGDRLPFRHRGEQQLAADVGVGRDRAARVARRTRAQRGERDPRRLPRLRHARRDHRARRRGDRCRRAGACRAPGQAGTRRGLRARRNRSRRRASPSSTSWFR